MTFRGPIWVPKVSFLGVLGASLYWKVVSEFWFGHPKRHFWYPQNDQNGVILAILGVLEMALRVSKSKFWDHFSIQTSPQNPQKDTLGSQIRPQKVIFGHFAFLNIFTSFSLEHGPFFFNFKSHHLKFISGLSNFFQVIYMYKHSEKN